ncbi:membrane anchored protein in chemotaxis locus [Shewanella sp. Shew256]|uniref:membrane anchored protein in chemotaxis locus n=1 Tax=Shewanella sp. Shew256 TaxID=1969376 RepID=UPI003F91594E
MSTNMLLIIVLMAIAILCLAALSLDYHRKIMALRDDVKRLESTQILLMVPDEQAQAIASWLASHPDQTKAMLKLASPGEQKAVTLGPETFSAPETKIPPTLEKPADDKPLQQATVDPVPELLRPETSSVLSTAAQSQSNNVPVVISENADGVKVISLPNGGIRVTTREGE